MNPEGEMPLIQLLPKGLGREALEAARNEQPSENARIAALAAGVAVASATKAGTGLVGAHWLSVKVVGPVALAGACAAMLVHGLGDTVKQPESAASVVQRVQQQVASAPAQAKAAAPAAPQAEGDDLADRVRAIEAANSALSANEPVRAASLAADYRRRWPEGALELDSRLLEIDALVAAGRKDEARARGSELLERHADEATAGRVRRALGE
jgi:hypothetical protein